MEKEPKSNSDFLLVLKSLKSNPNPFGNAIAMNSSSKFYDYNYFGFAEDLYNFEIKCPICFGRVSIAKRPDHCFHIFCGPCLTNWSRQSHKCPYCRQNFKKILKVSFSEPWVKKQYT
jgi:hypothetical protein